jgi:hypothetical protein
MRRITFVSAMAAVLAIFGLGAPPASARPFVETFPVGFELSSDTCSKLPAGTTIEGSGTEKSITTVRTNASGITTVMNATHAHGTATDQDGNVYVFDYSNEFRATNTLAYPDVISGLMTDHFVLAGRGPTKLNNGFVSEFTAAADFSFFSLSSDPIHSHGDPLSFPDGAAHCDPL